MDGHMQDIFARAEVSLSYLNINYETGEFVALPEEDRLENRRDPQTLLTEAVKSLERFFAVYGIEMRDIIPRVIERKAPIENVLEVRANLMPIDPIMPLKEVLTEAVKESLNSLTTPFCTTTAVAVVTPIHYKGICVNRFVTLQPTEGAEPFSDEPRWGNGTYEHPLRQSDGTYCFALSTPFEAGRLPVEAEVAAIRIGAVLMELRHEEAANPTT